MSGGTRRRTPCAREEFCLGISLGARFVGLAIASREYLLVDRVLNLRKLDSKAAREHRFGQVITKYLENYPISNIAVALSPRPRERMQDIDIQRTWLIENAQARRLPLSFRTTAEITECLVGKRKERKNLRGVAEHLSGLFPELWSKAPSHDPAPGAALLPELMLRPRYHRHERERYWLRMFLALAAAHLHLTERINNRL